MDKVQEIGNSLEESHKECFHNNYHLCRLIRVEDGKYLPEDVNFNKENALKFLTIKAADVKELLSYLLNT